MGHSSPSDSKASRVAVPVRPGSDTGRGCASRITMKHATCDETIYSGNKRCPDYYDLVALAESASPNYNFK